METKDDGVAVAMDWTVGSWLKATACLQRGMPAYSIDIGNLLGSTGRFGVYSMNLVDCDASEEQFCDIVFLT